MGGGRQVHTVERVRVGTQGCVIYWLCCHYVTVPFDGLRYAPSCIYGGLRSDIVAVDGKDNGRNWPSRCGELSSKDAGKAHQCMPSLHC